MNDPQRRIVRVLLPLLAALALAVVLAERFSRKVEAQFQGAFMLQNVTMSFSVPAGTPTPRTIFTPRNFGQMGHTISYVWSSSANTCTLDFEVSDDGVIWQQMAFGPSLTAALGTNTIYMNGYFNSIRIVVNPSTDAGCTTSVHGLYTGYQAPVPIPPQSVAVPKSNIAAAQNIVSPLSTASIEPIVTGFQCFNPNAATAFLQLVPGAIGSGILYQVGIPTGATYNYSGPPLSFPILNLKAGAATAADGATAVASPLVCTFELNPFGPLLPQD